MTLISYDDRMVPPKATPLADWIYRLRLHLDMTQVAFAEWLQLAPITIQQWEYGKTKPTGGTMTLLTMVAEQNGFESPPENWRGEKKHLGPRRDTKTG